MALEALAPNGNWSSRLWAGIGSLSIVQKAGNATASLINAILVRPLAQLYLFGPTYLGFWGGRRPDEICSQLTGIDANHWNRDGRNLDDCLLHIENHFNSWLVLAYTALYFTILATACWWLVRCRNRSSRSHELTIRLGPDYLPARG